MFEYIVTKDSGDFNIQTPFVKDFKEINHEVISQTPECIHSRDSYPNGFVIETKAYADRILVKSSHELINDGVGNFSIKL